MPKLSSVRYVFVEILYYFVYEQNDPEITQNDLQKFKNFPILNVFMQALSNFRQTSRIRMLKTFKKTQFSSSRFEVRMQSFWKKNDPK